MPDQGSFQTMPVVHTCRQCGIRYDPYRTGSYYFCSDDCGQAGLDEAAAAILRPPPSKAPDEVDFDPDQPLDF